MVYINDQVALVSKDARVLADRLETLQILVHNNIGEQHDKAASTYLICLRNDLTKLIQQAASVQLGINACLSEIGDHSARQRHVELNRAA